MQLHHPLGKIIDETPESGADKIGDGLFGYFPMTTPLVNIVTPTYLSETANYNYSLDRVANPTKTIDISDKLRWENSSKAIKGNVGMKVSDTATSYEQCPKLVPINYGCENAFSMSVIINKHGNISPTCNGETAIFLKFGTRLLKVLVTTHSVICEYGEHASGFNLLASQQSIIWSMLSQIEHITITYERISVDASIVKVYDSTCSEIALFGIDGLFSEEVYLHTSGNNEITNMRTYFIKLPLNVIKNICFMGDFKSKIFVSDDDFSFEYDWNNEEITSKNNSVERYPYGSCRAFSVGNERLGKIGTPLEHIFTHVPDITLENSPKKERFANKSTSTDSMNYKYLIEANTSIGSDLAESLGNINISSSIFAAPFARTELWKIVSTNTPYIMSIMHYGYFFVKENFPDEEYFRRISVDLTGINWQDIKSESEPSSGSSKLIILTSSGTEPGGPVFGSNDARDFNYAICIHNMTDETITVSKYKYSKTWRRYLFHSAFSDIPPYHTTPTAMRFLLISDCNDDDCTSILLVGRNSLNEIVFIKNIEAYEDASALNNIKKPLCMLESVGDARVNMNFDNGGLIYNLEGNPTFFQEAITSRHYEFRQGNESFFPSLGDTKIQNMIVDNEFPKYQKSLTKIEQIKYSGKCMASSIVELNFGIYNDIKYLFSPYCNIKSADNTNTYTLSTEQWTEIEESNLVEKSLVPKNVSFTISNTELLNTRIVADISNNGNNLIYDYAIGDIIPSLDNYNFIKIGGSKYLYSSSGAYIILNLSEEVGGFRYNGLDDINNVFRQSSLNLGTKVSEIILYKGAVTDNNVIIIGDVEGHSTVRCFDEPFCSMDEIVIKANSIYEICQYSKDIEQYIEYRDVANRMKFPHVYFLPKEESYNYFPTKDTLQLHIFIHSTTAIKRSFFSIGYYTAHYDTVVEYLIPYYRFDEQNTSAMVNRVYGINRFIRTIPSSPTSGPTYGYGVHVGDAENGSLDTSLWRLETTVSGLSSNITQASRYTTLGKTNYFIFELEHLKSEYRKTHLFDIVEFCNNFPTLNNATLRVRNPITKESYKYDDIYFQSPEISYTSDDVKEIIDVPYQRYVYKNERALPSTKFCDTSVNEPTISNEVYVPFGSENRIILAGDGLGYDSPNKHPDGTSITLYSTGYVYSYFIVIKKDMVSDEIYLQDDDTNCLYKAYEIGEIKLVNGFDINTFPENYMEYDMTPLIPIDGLSKTFGIYGFKRNHNCITPFQIEREPVPNIIEAGSVVLKSELLNKYPAIYTHTFFSLFEDSVKYANDIHVPLYDIFLGLSQSKKYKFSRFTDSRKKSWVAEIGVNSGIEINEPEVDSNRVLTITVSSGTSARRISDEPSLFDAGTYRIEQLYNEFILGFSKSADKTQLNIEIATFSSTEDIKAVQTGIHSFSLEKAHSLITPISNGIEYNDVYSYFVKTHNYTQPIENGFLLKEVEDDSISLSFKNKRHLDQISVRIERVPEEDIPGIKTNNVIISSVYPNNKVSIERSDLEYSIYNPDDEKNILISDSKALVYGYADATFKLNDSLDSYCKYDVYNPETDSLTTRGQDDTYTENNITKTGTREITVYSLTPPPEGEPDVYENYLNKYTMSLQCEVLPYAKRTIEIRDAISYSTSSEFSVKFHKEIDTGEVLILPETDNIIEASDLGDQNEISSIKIIDILPSSTYFGNDITINKISIPYNNVEIFRVPSESALMYYDFYGKSHKQYNKLNLIDTCTISENKTNQKIGVQSDSIEINNVRVRNSSVYDGEGIKEISFLIKYDNLDLLGSSSDAFSIDLGALNLFDEFILDKTYDGWKHISIRFDDTNYTVYEYDYDADIYNEIKPASPHSFISIPLVCKLSILNTRWSICDLEIKNAISESGRPSLDRLIYENSIQVVDGKYYIPDGKYLYSESHIPVSKSEINLDFEYGTTIPPDFLYGKLQNVYGRASKYPLILFDEVYSYSNVPDNNKLITQNEAEISESPLNVSFDIFIQKLGATELNNPVIFVHKFTEDLWLRKDPPKNSDELIYVACLISDNTHDTVEMQSFMEYDSYSYNRNLPLTYTYTNQKAILGRQIVMVDSIEGTFEHDDRIYRVIKVSPIDKQRFFPSHIEGEWIRNVYDFSDITESYEFNDNMVDAESDIYKPSRASGSLTLKDDIYKFNKFGNRTEKYSVDKGCAVYLFEGHIDNPILQSTLFIDTIVTNTKEESIQISLKNKVDLIYDKKVINYKTFENVGIKEIISQALFPYFYVLDDMVTFSASLFYCESLPPNIKTINFSSFNTIGEIFDAICSCGFNIWIDELERVIIDTDVFSKLIYEDKKVEYENGYNSAFKDGIRDAGNLSIDNINDLTDDIVISEKDGLIVNKIELAHENLVPMYERSEYVKGDKIYPVNNIGLDIATSDTVNGSIVYFDSETKLIKPSLLTAYKTIPDFNKLKMKTGVMCVVRRGEYELQYKFIQAKKESE